MTQQLKHDVMYHHGMGGPPQRPLQVRSENLDLLSFMSNVYTYLFIDAFQRDPYLHLCSRDQNTRFITYRFNELV